MCFKVEAIDLHSTWFYFHGCFIQQIVQDWWFGLSRWPRGPTIVLISRWSKLRSPILVSLDSLVRLLRHSHPSTNLPGIFIPKEKVLFELSHKAITGKFLLIDIQKEIPICKSLHYFYIVSFPFFSLCDCLKTRWEPFAPIAWFSFENATATNGGFTDLAPMSMRYLLRVSHRKYGSFNNFF